MTEALTTRKARSKGAPAKPKPKAKRKIGRPSLYTPAVAKRICDRIANGESLVSICKSPTMPSHSVVRAWIAKDAEFQDRYARAKEDQADRLAEEIIEISDHGSNDWMDENDPENPGYRLNGEHIQRSRLRVDARKWVAAKLKPKVYGERASMEVTGKDGAPLNPTAEQAAQHILGLLALQQAEKDDAADPE